MMKKTFSLLIFGVMLFLTLGFVSAGVGSPDTECQDNGFDYGIAKYECGSTTPEEGSYADDYDITVDWTFDEEEEEDCYSVDWTADPAVDGILSKEATETFVYSGGTSGTITQGEHSISHITFCGNYPPVVPEFGTVVGMLTALGALGVFFLVRRK